MTSWRSFLTSARVRSAEVPITREPGYEADDIIGTFACQAAALGLDVVIVTNDKDMCQLVTDHVKILRTERERRAEVDGRRRSGRETGRAARSGG